MDEQIKTQLTEMMDLMQQAKDQNDPYTLVETRVIWQLNAAAIQAYASCQVALQLARIADVLEEMYKSPKGERN